MKIKNITIFLSLLLAFVACSDDTDPRLVLPKPVVLEELESSIITITEENLEDDILTLTWTADQLETVAITNYGVQIAKTGTNFTDAQLLGQTSKLSYTVNAQTLNDFVAKYFAHEPKAEVRYDVRIVSVVSGKDGVSIIYPETASESQIIIVTTTAPAVPEKIFMIGSQFGNWDWSTEGIVEMIPVNGQAGEFWAIKYLEKDKGFKWAPTKAWTNAFAGLTTNEGYTFDGDGNAIIAADGLYMIYINYIAGKIVIEEAKISGMGDCFKGWTEGESLFTNAGGVATITTLNVGELRITAGSSATATDWWKREFVLLNGVIEYRGNGGDQERVTVAAGKVVTLDFNANTGTIK